MVKRTELSPLELQELMERNPGRQIPEFIHANYDQETEPWRSTSAWQLEKFINPALFRSNRDLSKCRDDPYLMALFAVHDGKEDRVAFGGKPYACNSWVRLLVDLSMDHLATIQQSSTVREHAEISTEDYDAINAAFDAIPGFNYASLVENEAAGVTSLPASELQEETAKAGSSLPLTQSDTSLAILAARGLDVIFDAGIGFAKNRYSEGAPELKLPKWLREKIDGEGRGCRINESGDPVTVTVFKECESDPELDASEILELSRSDLETELCESRQFWGRRLRDAIQSSLPTLEQFVACQLDRNLLAAFRELRNHESINLQRCDIRGATSCHDLLQQMANHVLRQLNNKHEIHNIVELVSSDVAQGSDWAKFDFDKFIVLLEHEADAAQRIPRTGFSGISEQRLRTANLLDLHHWCDEFEGLISEIRNDLEKLDDADWLSDASVESELPFPWERKSQQAVEHLSEFWPCYVEACQDRRQLAASSEGFELWGQLLNSSSKVLEQVSPSHEWNDSVRQRLKTHPEHARTKFLKLVRVILKDKDFPELQASLAPLRISDVDLYQPTPSTSREVNVGTATSETSSLEIEVPPKWFTAADKLPLEFKHGPLEGKKRELVACMNKSDQRQIENVALDGGAVLVKIGRTTWQLWFKDEQQFAFRLKKQKEPRSST